MSSYLNRGWNAETLAERSRNITPFAQRHLENVYFTLFLAMQSCASGFFVHIEADLNDMFILVGLALSILWLPFLNPRIKKTRIFLFLTAAFFGGALSGAWISWFFWVHPRIIVMVFVVFSLVFLCIRTVSTLTGSIGLRLALNVNILRLRRFLLANVAVLFLVATPHSMAYPNSLIWILKLSPPIIWFFAYVSIYSRELVPKIENEERDFVRDAIAFFTDFFGICGHTFKILFRATVDDISNCLEYELF